MSTAYSVMSFIYDYRRKILLNSVISPYGGINLNNDDHNTSVGAKIHV